MKRTIISLVLFMFSIPMAAKITGTGGFWLGMSKKQVENVSIRYDNPERKENSYVIENVTMPGVALPTTIYINFNEYMKVNNIKVALFGTMNQMSYTLESKYGEYTGSYKKLVMFCGATTVRYWHINGRILKLSDSGGNNIYIEYLDHKEANRLLRELNKHKSAF